MSRSTEPRGPRDEGFTLVEVIVAIGILLVLIAAVLPLMITGIRTTDVVRASVQEKGLAQTELERMRNLPFHVAVSAGNYVDVLDRYYPNLTTPSASPSCGTAANWKVPAATWSGYVPANGTRCAYEPSGAFYRTVRTTGTTVAGDPLPQGFVLVVATQFLNEATPPSPVVPQAGYNRTVVNKDRAPSRQIGVMIAVFRTGHTNSNPMTTYSQIVKRDQLEPLVRSAVEATTISMGTTTADGLPLTVSAGRLDLNASLTEASIANAVLAPVTAGVSTGQQGGTTTSVSAPPAASLTTADYAADQLVPDCALACWGASRRSSVALSADNGLPTAGSPTAPVQVAVRDLTNGGVAIASGTGATYLGERTAPVVKITGAGVRTGITGCGAAETGDTVPAVASGYLRTTAPEDPSAPSVVEACGVARATSIGVVPTTFAPQGVLRVTLRSASVSCKVTGAGHTASSTAAFNAVVERWTPGGTYTVVGEVTQDSTSDPLGGVPLTTPVGSYGTLGDYIESWSMLTKPGIRGKTATGQATVQLPGVVNLTTKPVRLLDGIADEQSVVTLSVGALSCIANDQR